MREEGGNEMMEGEINKETGCSSDEIVESNNGNVSHFKNEGVGS